ncbi:MAG: flavodoxin family protein [Dehalobacterium sp.]|jgi:multimeric flavodoxin WrbA
MKKKIVVITGSPRHNGNSFLMTDAFIKAAEEKGHIITRFDAGLGKVGACIACDKCFSKEGKACVFDDDFNKIAPLIEDADGVVFTAPLYWYTFPGQIKNFIDKMYSFRVGAKDLAGKECGLLVCCAEQDASAMEGILFSYQRTVSLVEWQSLGEVMIPGVLHPGEVKNTDGLQKAAALANAF